MPVVGRIFDMIDFRIEFIQILIIILKTCHVYPYLHYHYHVRVKNNHRI